ncbi:MAG: branched-chain amino acid ABC transporter substrate-binding protein [Chloroflexi bacterium]|nr:branched-chain amino acid ABC transporter substrate-binding protein [Chloroflexota bacterium]
MPTTIIEVGAAILRSMKWAAALVVALVLAQQIALGGCMNPSATFRGTFKIGLIAPFSGQNSNIGYNMLFAAKLAIKEWNESDRLKGYRIELIAQDDRNEAPMGLAQAKKMILDGDVIGVVGHPSNASALAAGEAYGSAGLTMITTEATADGLSADSFRTTFRLSAADSKVLSDTVRFLTGALKTRRLAIIAEPTLEHVKYADRLYEMTKVDGLSLTFGEPLKPEQTDFSDIARRMSWTTPQTVFFRGDYLSAGSLLNQMRLQRMSSAYLVDMGSVNPLFLKLAGNSADGAYIVSLAPNPTDIPSATAFVQNYRALSGLDPLPSAVLAYDATNIVLTAVERSLKGQEAPSRAGVLASLQDKEPFPGLASAITFDESRSIVDPKVYFYHVAGLRFPGDKQEAGE